MPPNIDPELSNRRATEQLTKQIEALNHHLVSKEQPTMASYLAQQSMASQIPGTTTTPESLDARFISWAAPPGGEQSRAITEPGNIGPNASIGSAEAEESPLRKRERSEHLRMGQLAQEENRPRSPESPFIGGMSEEEVQRGYQERLEIPQYKWRLDTILERSRDMAVKMAMKENEAGQLEPEGGIKGEVGTKAAEAASYLLQKAAPIEVIGGKALGAAKALMSTAYAGQDLGASLGYSPQTGVGGAYIMGMRNPLAAITSEAGKQGIGQRLGAMGAVLSGGINMEQAAGLREALSAEGFANQQEGFLGMYTGGENENLAQALEEPVKEGMRPSVAAGFANITRYGNANVKQLGESLKDLGSISKTLKQSIDQTGESMQRWAKEMEGQGALPLHSLNTYKELARTTGLQPELLNQVGESQLGQAAQVRAGMFPGTLGAHSGLAQLNVAKSTIEMAKNYFPGTAHRTWNPTTKEWEEESSEENKYAMWQRVFDINPSVARAIEQRGPQMAKAAQLESNIKKTMERWNTPQHAQLEEMGYARTHPHESKRAEELENLINQERYTHIHEEEGSIPQARNEMGEPIRTRTIERRQSELQEIQKRIEAHGKLGAHGRAEEAKEWGQMWPKASQAGISGQDFQEMWLNAKGSPEKAFEALRNKLGEASRISSEQEEGKTVIELSPAAKKFFEVQDPQAFKTATNAGGPSGSSVSALPNQPGISPQVQQAIKRAGETASTNRAQFTG